MTLPALTREFANATYAVLVDAFDMKRTWGAATVTKIAAALDLSESTFRKYLDGTLTFPPDIIAPLAELIAREKGFEHSVRLLQALVGPKFEVMPAGNVDDETARRLSDTPRVLRELGELLQELGLAEADGMISVREAKKFEKEAMDAVLAIKMKVREFYRRARAGRDA